MLISNPESYFMRYTLLPVLFVMSLLAGCSSETSGDNKLSQTRMNDIDSLEGTISDDIINTDQTNEEAPIDASAPSSSPSSSASKKEPAKPVAAKKPEPKADASNQTKPAASDPQE